MTQPNTWLEEELERYAFSFPILEKLAAYLQSSAHVSGKKIGWHCHLTGLTAAAAKVLIESGAKLFMSECNASTTDAAAVAYMRQLGAQVFQGQDGPGKLLDNKPEIISDTGFVLASAYQESLHSSDNYVFGGCEITSSGIHKMRLCSELRFPVININDGELKALIENYHGVGNGVIEALFRITGRMWSGRPVAVVGYGRVGAGVAHHLQRAGAVVYAVEGDAIRRLVAHYDGFGLMKLDEALAKCELIVTATGSNCVIGADQIGSARDGIILMNVGHWAEEIDIANLRRTCTAHRLVTEHFDEYEFTDAKLGSSKRIYVIGGGGPANVVMLSGSPEPTLIHLTTEILCMDYLLRQKAENKTLPAGEIAVPKEVQTQASILALQSLGLDDQV